MSLLFAGLTGLSHATPVFLVAAAVMLIWTATRVPDLGQAAIAGLAAALAARFAPEPALALIAIPVALAILGGALDRLVIHRLRDMSLLAKLLVTLGLFLMIQDAARLCWDSALPMHPSWTLGTFGIVAVIAIAPVTMGILLALPMHRHLVVPLAAALSGLAGTLVLLTQAAPSVGINSDFLADVLLTVLLGGLGSLPGAFVAAIVIALAQAFTAGLFPQSELAIPLAITAAVLLIRPAGLLGRASSAPLQGLPPLLIRPAPRSATLLAVAAFLAASGAVFFAGASLPPIMADVGIAILLAAGLHFLLGPGGVPSLGHAAFFGIGAYAAAIFLRTAGAAPSLPLLAAALALGTATSGVAALVVGLIVARLSATALALLTLVIAHLVSTTADHIGPIGPAAWTGLLPTAADWFTQRLASWLIFSGCVGFALLLRRLLYAPFGYALRAARDNPVRAAASGLPILPLRLAAFTIAGITAGLAGALTVVTLGPIHRSADTLLMLALGGIEAMAGPLVGALAYTGAANVFPLWPFLLGPALVAVPLLLPGGIAGASICLWRRAR